MRWSFPQDHVYYLDKATSIPLKVESFRDKAARDERKPLWVWGAQSLDKVHDHFVPLKSTTISYAASQQPSFQWNYLVRSIEFDKEYPDSTFWPTLQPGAAVMDTITSKGYEVPGAKKAGPSSKDETASTAQPIEATPPSDWTTTVPLISLVLGGAILIVGGLVWWRRH